MTHEMSFARDVANHVIFMDGGHIIEENPPQEFFTSPKEERTKQFLSRILSDASYSVRVYDLTCIKIEKLLHISMWGKFFDF